MQTQLIYGNWIRKKNLLILGLSTLAVGALILIPFAPLVHLAVIILFVIIFISFLFPLYAYWMFSQKGGRFQEVVFNRIIQRVGANLEGKILDIGSGNGVLAVKLAQQHSQVEVVGIDYWGKDWEYSQAVCEKNARAASVESRVHFQKGDAAALDFGAGTFDAAVSNLTFHEVKSVADKRLVLREALRVVRPGGAFAFVDYFYDPKYYGMASELKSFLSAGMLSLFECKPLQDEISVPLLLKHPKILGKVGIVYGRK
jgi:SAM-dependent methyltransferase